MKQIIYKVNGVNYLLFSMVCKSKSQGKSLIEKIQKYNGIMQSYEPKESFWNGITVKVNVLIPESSAISFSNE